MLPQGYRVISSEGNKIVVGMFDFLLMFEDAKPVIEYQGEKYRRGMIELIPSGLVGHCCSCREHIKI